MGHDWEEQGSAKYIDEECKEHENMQSQRTKKYGTFEN